MKILSTETIRKYRGYPVLLQTIQDDHYSFRVEYRSMAHYFLDKLTALDYIIQNYNGDHELWFDELKAEAAEVWADYKA